MAETLIGLLRAELKKRLADAMTPEWQAAVKQLGEKADREIELVLAFGRCLDAAFQIVKRFPAQYERWKDGKAPSPVLPPSPPAGGARRVPLADGDEEPWRLMKEEELEKIIAQTAQRYPAFRKMLGLPAESEVTGGET